MVASVMLRRLVAPGGRAIGRSPATLPLRTAISSSSASSPPIIIAAAASAHSHRHSPSCACCCSAPSSSFGVLSRGFSAGRASGLQQAQHEEHGNKSGKEEESTSEAAFKDDESKHAEAEKWSVVARMRLADVLERIQLKYESRPSPAPAGDAASAEGATNAQGARVATPYFMCSPSEDTEAVLKRMVDASMTALLVVENEKIVGTLTDRDYIAKVVLGPGGGGGATARVANVMTPAAAGPNSADAQLIGSPETRVLQALRIMGEKGIRLLPVMDGKKLLGFLTYFDLVDATVAESSDEIERLVCYIGGHDYAVGCQREGKIDPSIMSPPDAQPNFRPA